MDFKKEHYWVRDETKVNNVNKESTKFSLWVSYVQIYNGLTYDLLQKPSSRSLKLHDDADGNPYFKGTSS